MSSRSSVIAASAMALLTLGSWKVLEGGAGRGTLQDAPRAEKVLLRLASDSATVGHYKFTATEQRQLLFDLPSDDPRASLLGDATRPQRTEIAVAATVVSTPVAESSERRYIAYWLGFKRDGTDHTGLTPIQWDSIFQKVGRRAVLRFTPRGRPLGVEVGSDAARPVGQALGDVLSGLGLDLPPDSVAPGDRWSGRVALPVRAPDGSRRHAVISVAYRLQAIRQEADGPVAHIVFDGSPEEESEGESTGFNGRYFGESLFTPERGRYEQVMAVANLELAWDDPGGLPPARLVVEWQSVMNRS